MLYVLVVCASGLCMPVDSFGAYKLTLSECQERVVEMRRLTHAVSFDCYLSENNSEEDSDWLTDATISLPCALFLSAKASHANPVAALPAAGFVVVRSDIH